MSIAVVPVAGLGTRLLPLTKTQPKEMMPVGRRPVVHHIVEELIENEVYVIPLERQFATLTVLVVDEADNSPIPLKEDWMMMDSILA